MTPVEERIDHARIMEHLDRAYEIVRTEDLSDYKWRVTLESHISVVKDDLSDLLAEHSAREQALLKIGLMDDAPLAQYLARSALALPATESAQPEPDDSTLTPVEGDKGWWQR